jgi:hypothetical protein
MPSPRYGVGRVVAALATAVVLVLTAACGSARAPGSADATTGANVEAGNAPPKTVGYYVSGGLRPMGDQVSLSEDGTAVLQSFGKDAAQCTLVPAQAKQIWSLVAQADLKAIGPTPKATKFGGTRPVPDMRYSGLIIGDVRIDSRTAMTGAEPLPTLLAKMQQVYLDLLSQGSTQEKSPSTPMCR